MEEKKEMVNHPSHYCQGSMECIDGLIGAFGRKEVATFCKINAMKYIWRLGHKDDEAQEIGKIKWYLDKYLELTKPPIGVRFDTGEPVYEKPIIVWKENPTLTGEPEIRLLNKSELKQKGLTDREAENIINK
jgi:hypothetical protein